MKLKPFPKSENCIGLEQCPTCRAQTKAGSTFRASLGRAFVLPSGSPDFECPHGRPWGYVDPNPRPAAAPMKLGPGGVVRLVLQRLGYRDVSGCGCSQYAAQMDAWGYSGCLMRRREITDWFIEKAREAGLQVQSVDVWGLLLAAWDKHS